MKNEILTSEKEILSYFNEVAGKRFKPIKSNLTPISARLKDGYSVEELKQVIQLKTLEWKNNEVMAGHLCPTTLFRASNLDKYVNQLETIKQNPKQYAQYFAKINKRPISAADDNDGLADLYGN